ncbi:DUF1543 domain-containing protein [Alkalimonas amylolytica]|uniref:DUF1543 domain-containing protein n=1 Tax=Alkalimonas amylolytica TaxID=152573 RepID=A0A1H3Z5C2_ALKAM|nr:DUF1543 domain-containing protein [Alkalimonas amylolytica]SEA18698.1 protein of unknown function [Alkalimonas amylolytica]
MSMELDLFMVMLGGSHPKANTELHDVVFVAGEQLQQTYPQLRQLWFAEPKGLHMDAWMRVRAVDGFKLQLVSEPVSQQYRLFFLNLGGYHDAVFGEDHRYLLVVAKDKAEAKQKGKARQLNSWDKPHTDNVFAVDQCLEVQQVGDYFVQLTATDQPDDLLFENVYIVLPAADTKGPV